MDEGEKGRVGGRVRKQRTWLPAGICSCKVEIELRVESEDLKEVRNPGDGIETS